MKKEEAISIMKSFVSGQTKAEEFWEEFKKNDVIKQLMIEQEKIAGRHPNWWCSARTLEQEIKNVSGYYYSDMLFTSVKHYFESKGLPIKFDTFYEDRFDFFLHIQPSWLDMSLNEDFLINNVINRIPVELKSKSQQIKWCKEKIKELFKYDKTPPRWVQSAEWPIINGKPLVFKGQSKERSDDERVDFYFYDPDTGKETVVTQYY